MRAWYSEDMAVGLLYKCALGDIQPDAPVGEAGFRPLMSPSLLLMPHTRRRCRMSSCGVSD